jgi:LacI family transcriptional regulator
MVTIKDVAAKAGVSTATVSYVFNDIGGVGAETRARVLAVARELGYRPSALARGLKARASHTIGYSWHSLPGDQWHPILDRFLSKMAESAEEQGYHILTFASPSDPGDWSPYEELLLSGRVDGFVLSDTTPDDARIQFLLERGFPFVSFGRANSEWDHPYVDVDGAAGSLAATRHLLSLGHQRIAVMAWPQATLSFMEHRYQGYRQAMEEADIAVDPAWVARAESEEVPARHAAQHLLQLPPAQRPTAIVALSDMMAIGAMNAVYEAGLRPGKDVAITGYDDVPTAQYFRPPLTTLRQPITRIGELVVRMLLHLVSGEPLTDRHVLLEPELIVRGSSGEVSNG